MTLIAEPLAPGAILRERYEILRLIKGGGMSWVYQAREHRRDATHRLWALKELRMDPDDRHSLPEARQMFEQEAHLLVQLSHPNLPCVAAYFTEGERAYLVIEFIHGESLQARLGQARAPLLEGQVTLWAIQLCDVLDYIHTRQPPIIFRDIKPGNIMVTPGGQIKLIDFGIARTYKVGKQRDTITMGSENYAAPEQWGLGQTDPRSDVYSLGATLYHLLTDEPPLPSYVPGERVPIAQRNPSVSERLCQIVERAMAPDRGDRFHSAAEMRVALLRCLPPWERLRLQARAADRGVVQPTGPEGASPAQGWVTDATALQQGLASFPARYCRVCGIPSRQNARFCRLCGARMHTDPAAALVALGANHSSPVRLDGQPLVIGRASSSHTVDMDLNALDPDAFVSRRHAQITYAEGRYWVSDLGSSNGTFLNGHRLEPNRPVALSHGDRLRLGRVELAFTQR